MLKIADPEYFTQVLEFALANGCAKRLLERLTYLADYGGNPTFTTCTLQRDFAPYSFGFLIEKDGKPWFNGGLIYSGPDQPLNGGAPAFTVGIGIDSSTHGWSIHT